MSSTWYGRTFPSKNFVPSLQRQDEAGKFKTDFDIGRYSDARVVSAYNKIERHTLTRGTLYILQAICLLDASDEWCESEWVGRGEAAMCIFEVQFAGTEILKICK